MEQWKDCDAVERHLAAEPGQPVLTEAQWQELERRLAAHTVSPEEVIPWEEVKVLALARARR